MSNGKYIVGRNTKILVAPLSDCDRVRPPSTVFTTGALAAAAATTITVAMAPAITTTIKASEDYPLYLNFVEPSGKDHLVIVTADIEPADTALTVEPLKRAIASGATAQFPVLLRNRNSANLTQNDNSVDVMTFENEGWRDQITTMLGNGLEANGYYSPLDAGWKNCFQARLNFAEIYWELQLPKPVCDSATYYTKGDIFWGYGGIALPIEASVDQIINSNISITARGKVNYIPAA